MTLVNRFGCSLVWTGSLLSAAVEFFAFAVGWLRKVRKNSSGHVCRIFGKPNASQQQCFNSGFSYTEQLRQSGHLGLSRGDE